MSHKAEYKLMEKIFTDTRQLTNVVGTISPSQNAQATKQFNLQGYSSTQIIFMRKDVCIANQKTTTNME